jgi:Major tropism determinant N-terminal domain
MAVRIQLRRDTAANWVSANPVLRAGEIGIETDTLKFKIGTGATWTATTNYANVTPTGLQNSLGDYILLANQGKAGGPSELNLDGDLVIPENSIVLWNDDNYTYNTTVTATQPTANRTITLPNNSGTVALTSDLTPYAPLAGATFTGNIQVPTTVTFEGATADSYETALVATDPTADRTITLPDRDGTVITTGDTGTVTNTMLAGSIANNKLANSSVTINGFEIALGGTAAYGTDNISEGTTNLYFTNERAQDAVATALSNGTHTNITVSYDDNANAISLTGAQTYNDENARDAVSSLITNSTHDGVSVAYTDSGSGEGTLVFTNTDKGSSQNIFKNIIVGATTVVADGNNDTLTIVGSNGVGAIANAANDVIEIYNTGVTSLTGTANEVEVDTNSGAIIVGLPNDVTISGNLTLSTAPTQASHAVTKSYVDAAVNNVNIHESVVAATTTNVSLASGPHNNEVLDGVTLSTGNRILIKNQNTASQNGIYIVNGSGSPTRATDYDAAGEVSAGDFIFVQGGTVNANTGWVQTSVVNTVGTDSITFTQFSGAGTYLAGTGLSLTGNTFAIDTATTVNLNSAQTLTNKTITGTFTGNLTGNVTGNADTVTNGVYTTGTYSNPSWITGLAWSKISSTPTTIAGYGITDPIVLTSGTYSNPAWITGLAWSKISSTPTTISGYGITNAVVTDAANTITAASASTKPLIIKAAASQSANLQEWQYSDGSTAALVSNTGVFWISTANLTNYGHSTFAGNIAGNVPVKVIAAPSQSASIQEWQNSSNTVLAKVDSSGNLTAASIIKSGGTSSQFLKADGSIDSTTYLSGTVATTSGGTGLTSYATGDIVYASASNTLAKLAAGTNGQILTLAAGVPTWAAAPITLPSQTGNSGKYLTTDGTNASWGTLVVPIEIGTATLTANTATNISTTALSGFTSIEYMVSLKQGSKVRTSKVVLQTDGTSVDMTEFAITETGGTMTGVVVSATTSGTDAVLQATVTDAATTNVNVKFSKVKL